MGPLGGAMMMPGMLMPGQTGMAGGGYPGQPAGSVLMCQQPGLAPVEPPGGDNFEKAATPPLLSLPPSEFAGSDSDELLFASC